MQPVAIILVVMLVALMVLGVPITFSMGIASLVAIILSTPKMNLMMIPAKIFAGGDSFPLLAIIYFMIAGELMLQGGLTKRIINLAKVLLGWMRGSMIVISFACCAFFGAISGSSLATTAAIGSIMYPEMVHDDQYDPQFAATVQAVGGTLGTMIPPSIPLILYGCIASASVGNLFIGVIVPGLIMMLIYMVTGMIIIRRKGWGIQRPMKHLSLGRAFLDAIPAILSPVIILGGIYGGIFTPTEAAVVACLYSLIIGVFIYKELTWKNTYQAFLNSAKGAANVMFLCCGATLFGYCMTLLGLPQFVAASLTSVLTQRWEFLLVANLIFLVCGMFIDATTTIMLIIPLLFPVASAFGIDLVHFGIITCINLSLGMITPPFGACMFVATNLDRRRVTIEGIYRNIIPFCITALIGVFLVTYVEDIAMFLIR